MTDEILSNDLLSGMVAMCLSLSLGTLFRDSPYAWWEYPLLGLLVVVLTVAARGMLRAWRGTRR